MHATAPHAWCVGTESVADLDDAHDAADHGCEADEEAEDLEGVHQDPLGGPPGDVVLRDVHADWQKHGEGPEAQRAHDSCTGHDLKHQMAYSREDHSAWWLS